MDKTIKKQRHDLADLIVYTSERLNTCQTVAELDNRYQSLIAQATLLYKVNMKRLIQIGKFD